MGYNERKDWLDEQSEYIDLFKELVRTRSVAHWDFDSLIDARKHQFFLSNVRYGMGIHYKDLRPLVEALRIWVHKNHELGMFRVHIGTSNNYTYQRRGKTHLKRRLAPPTIQGRPPAVPVSQFQPTRSPTSTPTTTAPEPTTPELSILEYEDPVTDAELPELLHTIGRVCSTAKYSRVILTQCTITKDKLVATMHDDIVAREFQIIDATGLDSISRLELNYIGDFIA